MNNPIILNSQQAQELHTTGRLTGYREKCEWQPPKHAKLKRAIGNTFRYQWLEHWYEEVLTPPRDTDTTYAVKEPFFRDIEGDVLLLERESFNFPYPFLPATEMKEDEVRQHARITDRKLIIESGELWWDFGDLEKVVKA